MSWNYPNGFDYKQAIVYARFCQQAYFQYYILTNTPPDFGYPSFAEFMQLPPAGYKLLYNIWYDEGEFTWEPVYFGYVAASETNPTQVVVAIRGTESAEEWLADILQSSQVPNPIKGSPGLVHDGIATIYNGRGGVDGKGLQYYQPTVSITPPKKTDTPVPLATVLASAKLVVVTGHSLGAALGTLLTLDVAVNIKCSVSSYNFGSPMVGDPIFANSFNGFVGGKIAANFRVANGMDIVPNLPPNVFYPPASQEEYDYMQVTGYCPVDSGILSILSDAHSLSNYVIGLSNIGNAERASPIQRPASAAGNISRRGPGRSE